MPSEFVRLLHEGLSVDKEQATGALAALTYLYDSDPKTFSELVAFCQTPRNTLTSFARERLQAMAILKMDGKTFEYPFREVALSCAVEQRGEIVLRSPFVSEPT